VTGAPGIGAALNLTQPPHNSMLERGTIGERRFRTRSATGTTWALMAQGIDDARIFVRGRPRGGFSCLMPSPVPTSSTSALIEISFARFATRIRTRRPKTSAPWALVKMSLPAIMAILPMTSTPCFER